jgi:hypothetical protein
LRRGAGYNRRIRGDAAATEAPRAASWWNRQEVTALVRKMLEDPEVRADQQWAWWRWRSGDNAIKQD